MGGFAPKCGYLTCKCGKLRWKCAKLANLQGSKSWNFHFSTPPTCWKVEKQGQNYTFAENRSVEKNKFQLSHLTENIQKEGALFIVNRFILVHFVQKISLVSRISRLQGKKKLLKQLCAQYTRKWTIKYVYADANPQEKGRF